MKAMKKAREQLSGRLLALTLLAACFFLVGFTFSSNLKIPKTDEEKKEYR